MLFTCVSRQFFRTICASKTKMENRTWDPASVDLKSLNRPLRVSVEGNIGSGKTTLMNYFSKFPAVQTYEEPLDKWRNVEGHNLLGLLYDDMAKWNETFQSYVQLTRMQIQCSTAKDGILVQMFERSVQNNRYCFLENSYKSGLIKPVQYEVLCRWYEWIEENVDITLDLIVYLKSNPEVAYKRVLARNRNEEKTVSLDYLKSLHEAHENWLSNTNLTTPVFVIDANASLNDVEAFYDKILPSLYKNTESVQGTNFKKKPPFQIVKTKIF